MTNEYHFLPGPGPQQVTLRKLDENLDFLAEYVVTYGEKPWCTCPAVGHARKGHNFNMALHKHVQWACDWIQQGADPAVFLKDTGHNTSWEERRHG